MRRFAFVTMILFGMLPCLTGSAVAGDPDLQGFINWSLKYGTTNYVPQVDPGYIKAEKEFTDALAKKDKKAVGSLLSDNFKWVEPNGELHTKAQVLADLDPLAKNYGDQIDVRTTDFTGTVERALGIHHNMRFAYVWAKEPSGWHAFTFLDMNIAKSRKADVDAPQKPTNGDADCVNPCRTVPFKPADAAQAQVLKNWMEMKTAEWHPNPELWSSHADIYHETMGGGDLPMLQHVVQLANARRLYGEHGAGPGVPVLEMKMYTFGKSVIQEETEGRKGPSKPEIWKIRLFVDRGEGFKVSMSAQTRIEKNME